MRISDWSSDVCSSDLDREVLRVLAAIHAVDVNAVGLSDFGKPGNYFARKIARWSEQYRAAQTADVDAMETLIAQLPKAELPDDGSAALVHGDFRLDNLIWHPRDRKSVVVGKSVSVRVDLGGSRTIKKKKKKDEQSR